jgi:hypothetical protein
LTIGFISNKSSTKPVKNIVPKAKYIRILEESNILKTNDVIEKDKKIAIPPIKAVGFECHRSFLG